MSQHDDAKESGKILSWAGGQFKANPPHLLGAPNMAELIYLEEPNVLRCLEARFENLQIYTAVSNVSVTAEAQHVMNPLLPLSMSHPPLRIRD